MADSDPKPTFTTVRYREVLLSRSNPWISLQEVVTCKKMGYAAKQFVIVMGTNALTVIH